MSGPLGYSQAMLDQAISTVFVERAYILTRSEQPNGAGGQQVVYAKPAQSVPCALGPVGGGEGPNNPGDRIDDRTTNVITLPAGTEATERDQVEIVGRGRFEVTAVRRRSLEIARELEVIEASGDSIEIEEEEP